MPAWTRGAVLGLFLTLSGAFVAAADQAPADRIALPVRDALRTEEWVRVLVFLDVPAAAVPMRESLPALRLAVREAQERVLASVPPEQIRLHRRMEAVPAFSVTVSHAGMENLAAAPGVVRIDLDAGGSGALAEAVPLTNTDDVHALGYTGAGVTVAVIDSGIDRDHPDLMDDLLDEACFCSGCCPGGVSTLFGPGAAEDDNGHGSHVSGIVTSNGTIAPVGTAPDAGIVAVKVLDSNNRFCCISDVVAGLDWILNNRPDVDAINMSLGTDARFAGNCDSSSPAFAFVINALRANNVLSFVSTGNNGSLTQMQAPACIANAISVAAVWDADVGAQACDAATAADKITCFSNRNSVTDILAPGAPITSTVPGGGTAVFSGTSMAAPHVAGCAANLLQAAPGTNADAQEARLESIGVLVSDPATGLVFPRVNCLPAVDPCFDGDGDTYPISAWCPGIPTDCDDSDPDVHPDAAEACNLSDDDCDALVDEQACTASCPITVLTWDGSTETNLRAPSARARYARAVYLIRASELEPAGFPGGASLHSISWAYGTAPGLAGGGSLKIYLQNTSDATNTKSPFWSTAITGMTEVFNAATVLPDVTGPFGIPFAAPFTYNGDGLYVAFDWQYPSPAPLSTTATVQCNAALGNGLLGSQSPTAPPSVVALSNFRPATWFNKGIPLANVPLSVDVVEDGVTSACAGAPVLFTCDVSGQTGTVVYQWTENGLDVPGANAATHQPNHGEAGSFIYNCRATDDGRCLGVQDPVPSTGTWIAEGASCDDGDGCTAPDACTAAVCAGTPIQPPAEATGLSLLADKQTLTWIPAEGATVNDVVRGLVPQLPVGSGGSETCLGSFVPAAASDATLPPGGAAFWYLVRGRNSCGNGSYGDDGDGLPRVTAVCP